MITTTIKSLSKKTLSTILFHFSRTPASTSGPQWGVSFQRIVSKAEGKAWGPQQKPRAKFMGT